MPLGSILHDVCVNPLWVSIPSVPIGHDAVMESGWEQDAHTLTHRALMPSGVSSPLRPRTGELCFCLLKRNGACAVIAGLLRAACPSGCSCCCSVCLHLGKCAVLWVCQDPVLYPSNFYLGSFWCSSLPFSKILFSGCGTDNECWFLHWLAILQPLEVTFAAAGYEAFPY